MRNFLSGMLLLLLSCLGVNYFITSIFTFHHLFYDSTYIIFIVWIISLPLFEQHKPKFFQEKLKYVLSPILKSILFHLVIVLFIMYINSLNTYEYAIKAILLFSIIESIFISIQSLVNNRSKQNRSHANRANKKYEQNVLKSDKIGIISDIKRPVPCDINQLILEQLKKEITSNTKEIGHVEFFKKGLNPSNTPKASLLIVSENINNFKNINELLNSFYNLILNKGYIVLSYRSLESLEAEIFKKSLLYRFFYFAHFYIYRRAFPKIKGLHLIYKLFSGYKNKVISKTEVWGRLAYFGFDVRLEQTVNNITYLIARKTKTISENPNPSYAPLVRLNRVSYGGYIIKIYKIRSMYPYSEFLQQKVFELNQLSSTGKFKEDFRITRLGKIYRKYWIDELPQFLDWIRGEIKLVGIRAMSQQFFSLYPEEYQNIYKKVKPGIISPIFDESNDSFEDIVKIEQSYLEQYLKNPIRTDFKYFWLTVKQILKGVRSK